MKRSREPVKTNKNRWSVKVLKKALSEYGQSTSGRKAELIERLNEVEQRGLRKVNEPVALIEDASAKVWMPKVGAANVTHIPLSIIVEYLLPLLAPLDIYSFAASSSRWYRSCMNYLDYCAVLVYGTGATALCFSIERILRQLDLFNTGMTQPAVSKMLCDAVRVPRSKFPQVYTYKDLPHLAVKTLLFYHGSMENYYVAIRRTGVLFSSFDNVLGTYAKCYDYLVRSDIAPIVLSYYVWDARRGVTPNVITQNSAYQLVQIVRVYREFLLLPYSELYGQAMREEALVAVYEGDRFVQRQSIFAKLHKAIEAGNQLVTLQCIRDTGRTLRELQLIRSRYAPKFQLCDILANQTFEHRLFRALQLEDVSLKMYNAQLAIALGMEAALIAFHEAMGVSLKGLCEKDPGLLSYVTSRIFSTTVLRDFRIRDVYENVRIMSTQD